MPGNAAERSLEETSEQLRQSQKMEAIGRLAGGVAHDFNNLLLAINGYCRVLLDDVADRRAPSGFANEIRVGRRARRGAHPPAARVQPPAGAAAARPQPERRRQRDRARCCARLIGEDIRIELDARSGLRQRRADPSQIGQVLLNLAVNARDAMAGGGHTLDDLDAETTATYVAARGRRHAVSAWTKRHADAIFEPFFTTKDVGPGHRARALDRLRHRRAERRHDQRALRPRPRAPRSPFASRGRRRARDRPTEPTARPRAAPNGSSSSTTSTSFATCSRRCSASRATTSPSQARARGARARAPAGTC